MAEAFDVFISEADFRRRYEYTSSDLLGEGGFAQVYKAYDKQFHEYVALKFYNKGEKGKYDVLHEMKDSRSFSHKNIIRVHDAFVVRLEKLGTYSYVQVGVLEFANGGNLRDFVESKPPEESFIEVLVGILEGLAYLHREKQIIHRDLSPENILLYVEGNKWVPKISDFGISKKLDINSIEKNKKKSTQLLGKIEYMAPEQFYPDTFGKDGTINTNVDLWAFGIIVYELFMQRTPFGNHHEENPMAFIQSITNDPIPSLDEVPFPYRKLIEMCLVKDASHRVSNPRDLIEVLESKGTKPAKEPLRTLALDEIETKRSRPKWAIIILVVLLFLITGSYFLWFRNGSNNGNAIPEIKNLVADKKYTEALESIGKLPKKLKNTLEVSDLERTCILQISRDSTHALFNSGKYAAVLRYMKEVPEDVKSDSLLTSVVLKSTVIIARDSLQSLVAGKEFALGKTFFAGLDLPVKSDPLLRAMYDRLLKAMEADSLYKAGMGLFDQKKYPEAKSVFEKVAALKVVRKTDADSMLREIESMGKLPEPRRLRVIPAGCVQYYETGDLRIGSFPDNREIELKNICVAQSEMKITLVIKPSNRIITIYNPLSEKAFFVEYENGTRQIPLKDIKGIITNTQQRISQDKTLELIFDKLPSNVKNFNLVEGKNQRPGEKYWNFKGVILPN